MSINPSFYAAPTVSGNLYQGNSSYYPRRPRSRSSSRGRVPNNSSSTDTNHHSDGSSTDEEETGSVSQGPGRRRRFEQGLVQVSQRIRDALQHRPSEQHRPPQLHRDTTPQTSISTDQRPLMSQTSSENSGASTMVPRTSRSDSAYTSRPSSSRNVPASATPVARMESEASESEPGPARPSRAPTHRHTSSDSFGNSDAAQLYLNYHAQGNRQQSLARHTPQPRTRSQRATVLCRF
ncbi:hypothetical protein OIO90_003989 [Microbotryomycetes sp. JL221]|nr:hypothetical protein OIO90_003989 [Microbotryomycetes sp. JL221]